MKLVPFALAALFLLSACSHNADTATLSAIKSKSATMEPLNAPSGSDAKSAVKRALLLDPEVRKQAESINVAIDSISVKQAALLPQVDLRIGGGAGRASVGNPVLELQGDQLLFDFGRAAREIELADVNLLIEYFTFQSKVDEVSVDVLSLYRELKKLESILDITIEHHSSLSELKSIIENRIDLGAQAAPDLLEVDGRIARNRFEQLELRLRLSEGRANLQQISNTQTGGYIPDIPQQCKAYNGITNESIVARLQVVIAGIDLENATKSARPGISLSPIGRLGIGSGGLSTGVNISISSPLWEGGASQARVRQAENRLRGASAGLESAERGIIIDDARIQRSAVTIREKIITLNEEIELLQRTRDLYFSQYVELGNRSVIELLNADADLFDRKKDLQDSLYDNQVILLQCAVRSRQMRNIVGIANKSLYGYPLDYDL